VVDELAIWVDQRCYALVPRFNNATALEHGHLDEIEWLWN
jgi:hypothetical protein